MRLGQRLAALLDLERLVVAARALAGLARGTHRFTARDAAAAVMSGFTLEYNSRQVEITCCNAWSLSNLGQCRLMQPRSSTHCACAYRVPKYQMNSLRLLHGNYPGLPLCFFERAAVDVESHAQIQHACNVTGHT